MTYLLCPSPQVTPFNLESNKDTYVLYLNKYIYETQILYHMSKGEADVISRRLFQNLLSRTFT